MSKFSMVGYMVRYPHGKMGKMISWSLGVSLTEREARDRFKAKRLKRGATWKQAYREGCRVVPVRVSEI